MLASLSLIFLVGLAMGAICQKLKMPRIIGMLVTGIVLGPYVLDFLDPSILSISSELRKLALIIILLKAGLSLDLKDLKKAGRPAILMSFVPATCEIAGYILFAPLLLGINRIEAAVMGAVLGAVSPAVVIPRMVMLMEEKYGTKKAIPQMVMAGASCDDIFVIVLFTTFLSMAQGGSADIIDFVNIPVSIVLGILLGAVSGYGLFLFFETSFLKNMGVFQVVLDVEVLEIYDLKDSTHIVRIGPNGEPEFQISQGYGIPIGIMGFSDIQVTDSAIYVVFQGRAFKDIMQKAQQGINLPDGGQNIYVFSLEGKPLRKYVLDHYIHGISVDEQKGIIIATDVNKDEPIIEYKLL